MPSLDYVLRWAYTGNHQQGCIVPQTVFYNHLYMQKTMSRDRFTQIMRYLHFSDSTQQPLPGDQNYDPLYKVKPLLTHFNNRKTLHTETSLCIKQ